MHSIVQPIHREPELDLHASHAALQHVDHDAYPLSTEHHLGLAVAHQTTPDPYISVTAVLPHHDTEHEPEIEHNPHESFHDADYPSVF